MAPTTPTRADLIAYARKAAQANGINPDIFVQQIDQESGFDPNAHNDSSGADGIAQLTPRFYRGVNTRDPYASLDAAAESDAQYLKMFGGDYALMLAAYNAGPGTVQKAGGVPNIPETQTYVYNPKMARLLNTAPMQIDNGTRYMAGNVSDNGNIDPAQLIDEALGSSTSPADQYTATMDGTPANSTASTDSSAAAPATNPVLASIFADSGAFYTQEQYNALAQQHGGVIGVTNLTPTNKADVFSNAVGSPNPHPIYRYTFADQTYIEMQSMQDASGKDNGYVVIKGTAKPKAPITPTDKLDVVRDPRSGEPIAMRDPSNGGWHDLPKTATSHASDNWKPIPDPSTGNIVGLQNDTGQVIQLPKDSSSPVTQKFPDGSLQQYNAKTGTWQQIAPPNATDTQTTALDNQYKQLQIQQAQRNLMPEQQKLISDAEQTINLIQQRWSAGLISADEANSLMKNVWKGVDAGMQGTTLFQQQQEENRKQQAFATLGSNILDQRVSSGSSLASAILSAAASHIRMPAGQTTLGIDPFALANNEVTQLGGGQGVYDLAKSMLTGAYPQGNAQSGAQGGAQTQYPTTPEDVLKMYPELRPQQQTTAPPASGPPPGNPTDAALANANPPVGVGGQK